MSTTEAVPATTANETTALAAKVKGVLMTAPEGMTAPQIAQSLGLITDESAKEEVSKACKKIRVAARKAMGGHANGKSGRNAVYKLSA